jgi:5-formyltetrahydrofolate cyclo-ligase
MASADLAALEDRKRSLRRTMGEARSLLGGGERARASAAAAVRLAALPELRAATERGARVAGFVAIRTEIDPAAALDEARRGGARVALPRVRKDLGPQEAAPGPRLTFHVAARSDLRPGHFGILEPDSSCPEIGAGDVEVMIVPGLAFDGAGRRLGFGGGYYDEVLAGPGVRRPPFVVGLGYDFQVVDACPADDERDARVDCVVTDLRVIRCGEMGGGAASGVGGGAGAGEVGS